MQSTPTTALSLLVLASLSTAFAPNTTAFILAAGLLAALTGLVQIDGRNLLAQPELLSALQPNDVRPAGSCDIQLAEDLNSITYSCAGSTPTVYQRVHPAAPE